MKRLALLTALIVLAAAPAAEALTVVRDGDTIRIDAAAGEGNEVAVLDAAGMLRVTEGNNGTTATIVPGGGCAASVANSVDCGVAPTVTSVVANLGDMDDTFGSSLPGRPVIADAGSGNDGLAGGDSADQLTGGLGTDQVQGSTGNDTIDGGEGTDILVPGTGDDTTFGGPSQDIIFEEGGDNTISGGPGDDVFITGRGRDDQDGGPGDDQLAADGRFDPGEVVDGGPGRDFVSFVTEGTPMSLSLDNVANDGPGGTGNLLSIEVLTGGGANDTITGSSGPEVLQGSSGNDVINGGGGNDELYGSADDDTLSGEGGDDAVFGEQGNDLINGGVGNDLVYGHEGADDLVGGTGRDTVDFGGGGGFYRGATVTLDDVANDGYQGEGDNAHSDNENIEGTDGDDTLVGGPGPNTIMGGEGDDTIVTRDGGPNTASHDTALCGADEDSVQADPRDSIGEHGQLCENVDFGDVTGWGPTMTLAASGRKAGRKGVVALELGCPFGARSGCEGKVVLTVGGKTAGSVKFSVEAGGTAEKVLRLKKATKRTVMRRGRLGGKLELTVEDALGATQTLTKSVGLTK